MSNTYNRTKTLTVALFVVGLYALFPFNILAQLSSAGLPTNKPPATISISDKGEVKVKNLIVFQIAGSTFFARTYWDQAFVRWTIRTNGDTNLVKRFGGNAKLSEISVGDVLNVDGTLLSGADSLNINATLVRDMTLEKENGSFAGKVTKVDVGASNFVMIADSGQAITVHIGNGVSIKKGAIMIPLSKVSPGDSAIFVSGSYHEPTETIEATNVEIYQTPELFKTKNYQGTLKSLGGSADVPATLVVTISGVDYSVVLDSKAQVLSANKKPKKLQRFVVGDTVRFYGSIREAEQTTIDAEIIRNLDL